MSIFPQPQSAGAARSKASTQAALVYAVVLVAMALGQLFTFEKFIDLLASFELPLGGGAAYILAPVIIASEVFAVPFLLRMRLSPAFRVFSMGLGWLTALIWIGMTLWLSLAPQPVVTVGFLGTVGDLTPGWWAVFVSVAYALLAAWASWGLWPVARRSSAAKK